MPTDPDRRTVNSVHEEAEFLRVTLSCIGDGVITTDADGRVTSLNPAAEALTGWPAREAAGSALETVFRIFTEETRRAAENPAARGRQDGGLIGLGNHTLLVARDGTERPIDGSAAPVRNAAGAVVGTVLVFRDVTERRRLERRHADALAFATEIIATLREPFLVLDRDLRVRTANAAFYDTFRVARVDTEGRPIHALGDGQWDIPRLRAVLADVVPGDRPVRDFLVEHTFPALGPRAVLLNARRFPPAGDNPDSIFVSVEDVTDRRRAAHDLEVSETRYRRLFEAAQDGILIVDPGTGRITDANPFLTDLLGHARDELVGKELWEIGLFRDIAANRAAFRTLLEVGYIRYEDLPLRTHDGREIDVEFVSNVYQVDHTPVIQCNIRDVSDRKRAEEGLRAALAQLEERVAGRTADLARANEALTAAGAARLDLPRRLASAQEDERRRVARDLHDQMGQYLAAIGLGLKAIEDAAPDGSPARPQLRRLQDLADAVGRQIHRVALELRPTALDDLGLDSALSTYVEEWAARAGVAADFSAAGADAGRLPAGVETALYRVVQEALTNVLRHARAGRVSVTLHRTGGGASVVVEDDGAGFDAESVAPPAGSGGRLGLLGMRERLAQVGGTLTVESAAGQGTTVIARVPATAGGGDGE